MGVSRFLMSLLLALAFIAGLWVFGRSVFKGVTNWLLWALAALCVCAGVIALLEGEGRPLAFLGGVVVWGFAAYAVKVAASSHKRS